MLEFGGFFIILLILGFLRLLWEKFAPYIFGAFVVVSIAYWLFVYVPVIRFLVLLGTGLFIFGLLWSKVQASVDEDNEERRRRKRQRRERCLETAQFFSENVPFAKSVMTQEEVKDLIEKDIQPEELSKKIIERIEAAPGLVLGYQAFDNWKIDVKVPEENRPKHFYIIGKAGAGKSNLMRQTISQDIQSGQGIAVIAPEKEQIYEEILPYLPDSRIDDVILFEPSDPRCPSFNPFYIDEGETQEEKMDEMLTLFKRISGDTTPRMEKILVEALRALIGRPGATLLDIERLLDRTQEAFRQEIIQTTDNPEIAHFWRDTYPTYPKDAHLGLTNRLGRFLQSETIRRILCNPNKSLNFGRAMDEGRIMLFNLSDGCLGEQTSQMLGQLIVSKFQLAIMARARSLKQDRKPFYLYLDEFQTFTDAASKSYEKILSRARKYKVGITLAHQQTGQIPTDLLRDILGNVSTSVFFHVSQADAAKLSKELIRTENGETVCIDEEKLLSLKVGQAFCKIGQQSFPMQTYLADQNPDHRRAQLVAEHALNNCSIEEEESQPESPNSRDLTVQKYLSTATQEAQKENQPPAAPKAKPKPLEKLPGNGKRQLQPVAATKTPARPSLVDAVLPAGFDPEKFFEN